MAAAKAPKPKALLNRNETIGLAKRFVKLDKYDGLRDMMVLYRLYKQFPNRDFWLNYELGFQLNAMFWFLGKDGQDRLKRDWSVFHLDLKPQEEYKLEDTKVGEDLKIESKPKTMAEFLG